MRKLTTSEVRLGLFFAAAIFVALNLFLARWWTQQNAVLAAEESRLHLELEEGKVWTEGASGLGSASEWIAKNPPPALTSQTASSQLLAELRGAAESNGLKVLEENLLPEPQLQEGQAAALQAKLGGPFAGVTKLLFALQGPSLWRAIPRLIIRSDEEPPNVVVDMEIRQYYRPESPTAPAAGP